MTKTKQYEVISIWSISRCHISLYVACYFLLQQLPYHLCISVLNWHKPDLVGTPKANIAKTFCCSIDFLLPYSTILTTFWLSVNQRTLQFFSFGPVLALLLWAPSMLNSVETPLVTIGRCHLVTMLDAVSPIAWTASIWVNHPDCWWLWPHVLTIKFLYMFQPECLSWTAPAARSYWHLTLPKDCESSI